LHNGEAKDEKNYIENLSIHVGNGGLWGGSTTMHWISQYLQHPIHVGNKYNCRIMTKFGNNNQIGILNLVYENNPFELNNTFREGTSSQNIESHEDVHLDFVDQTNKTNIFQRKKKQETKNVKYYFGSIFLMNFH
jgi:hypothetical protein